MLKILSGGAKKKLDVIGIDPKDPTRSVPVSPAKVVAPVLCDRHNKALKPIDTCGNNFFEAVALLGERFGSDPPGTDRIVGLNGHDLERWCLKALCGFLARADREVPELWVRVLFGGGSILPPRGLFVYANVGDELHGDKIRIEEVGYRGVGSVGLIVQLLSHELVFSMMLEKVVAVDRHVDKLRIFRPESFAFRHANGSTTVIWLSWHDLLFHHSIDFDWSATARHG